MQGPGGKRKHGEGFTNMYIFVGISFINTNIFTFIPEIILRTVSQSQAGCIKLVAVGCLPMY